MPSFKVIIYDEIDTGCRLKICNPSLFCKMIQNESLYHFVYGIESNIPVCCVLNFVILDKFKLLKKWNRLSDHKLPWSVCPFHLVLQYFMPTPESVWVDPSTGKITKVCGLTKTVINV